MARLVEILARELREWPNGWIAVGQACDGSLHGKPFDGRHTGEKYSVCDRYITEEVTRAEWQAAVDALDIPKFPSDNPEWNGEGLPPVGTVCTCHYHGSYQGEVRVEFLGKDACVLLNTKYGDEQCGMIVDYTFKPILTPEQIAAEEKVRVIAEMRKALADDDKGQGSLAALYDAGYRKQEPK